MNKEQRKLYELSLEVSRTPVQHENHKRPVSRRELLGQGFIRMGSFVAAPSILSMIMSRQAYGQTCTVASSAGANFVPYMQFELSGGASIAGNFMFGKQRDGAPIEFLGPQSYATLGLPPELHPSIVAPNMEFGAPLHQASALLAGLKSIMSPEAIAKTALAGGAGTSMDDSRNNPLNGIQLAVNVVGGPGNLVQIAGTDASNTGGRTAPLDVGQDPSLSRARVASSNDVLGLVDPGLIAQRLTAADAGRIAQAAKMMSDKQLAMFQQKDLPAQVKELVQCGYIGSEELIKKDASTLTPQTDADVTGIVGINLNNADDQRVATLTKMLVEGNAAGATIQNGGYDYHGRGRVAQDALDFAAGRRIGMALEIAHRKGQPLFISVTSDGSVSAGNNARANNGAGGKLDFSSDSGSRGAYLMFAIGRETRPQMMSTQIGAFSDAGAVDTTYLATADSPRVQALNIVANYAALNNATGKFTDLLNGAGVQNPFAGQDRQYIAFAPLTA